MIYTMTVSEGFRQGGAAFDIATAEAGGKVYEADSKNGATMRLARQMVQDGLPDDAWQAVDKQGRVRFHGRSLHRLAKLTIEETEKNSPRLRKYRDFAGLTATTAKALDEAVT